MVNKPVQGHLMFSQMMGLRSAKKSNTTRPTNIDILYIQSLYVSLTSHDIEAREGNSQ